MTQAAAPQTMQRPAPVPESWAGELGPYGEIFSPLLLAGYSPDGALDEMLAANAERGGTAKRRTRGAALEKQYNAGKVFIHQRRIRAALAGKNEDGTPLTDPVEQALYAAVTVGGAGVSIRPPGMEMLTFADFAPVLWNTQPGEPQSDTPQVWQLGLPNVPRPNAKTQLLHVDNPAQAVAEAQRLYLQWCNAADEQAERLYERVLARLPVTLWDDFWLSLLEEAGQVAFGEGYILTMLDRHNTMRMQTPTLEYLLTTDRMRAVRITVGLFREEQGRMPQLPSLATMQQWLAEGGVLTPSNVEWGKGDLGLPAKFTVAGRGTFTLVKRADKLVGFAMKGTQYGDKLGETILESPVVDWLKAGNAEGRQTVVQWMLWHGGLVDAPEAA